MPECTGPSRVRISTYASAIPRSAVVNVGSPMRRFPTSATTMASASNSAGFARGYSSNGPPHSSSPSTITLTVHGGAPSKARMRAAWITTPLLSSAAPRP